MCRHIPSHPSLECGLKLIKQNSSRVCGFLLFNDIDFKTVISSYVFRLQLLTLRPVIVTVITMECKILVFQSPKLLLLGSLGHGTSTDIGRIVIGVSMLEI